MQSLSVMSPRSDLCQRTVAGTQSRVPLHRYFRYSRDPFRIPLPKPFEHKILPPDLDDTSRLNMVMGLLASPRNAAPINA